jgi:DNA-binding MarR family transcriptional regulator
VSADPPDHTPPANVLASIHVLSRRIGAAFHPEVAARFALTLPEWRVILTLYDAPESSASDIMRLWAMDKMAISRAVRRLVQGRLVARRRSATDRRSFTLHLTKKGLALYERVLPAANRRFRDIVSCLDRTELAQLRAALAKLNRQAERLAE